MELYKTVRKEGEAIQVIEKSRFIGHVRSVESRSEADEFIASVKAEYKDANHNVPAIVIGDKAQIQWASDDGEPQGTSGAPMVQMMVKEGLTNLAVVVTRYFGGIKLGTGGLVRAYTGTAKKAIEAAGVCGVYVVELMKVRTEYTFLSKLQNLASPSLSGGEAGFVIRDTEYGEKVTVEIGTFPENSENVKALIASVTAGKFEIRERRESIEKM